MPPQAPIRFEPSEAYNGLARVVVMLGSNYVGTIAERRGGAYEFVPHHSDPFCKALGLPDGPHIANDFAAIGRLVRGLLAAVKPPAPVVRYVPIRPDGTAWQRPFKSEAAAWRAVVKGTNSPAERRQRTAEMRRTGWKVRPR